MIIHLNLKARAVLLHVAAACVILGAAALGVNWVFSRMVLGQFDQALVELFKTEASAALADPKQSLRVHEMPPGIGRPSFPRLDKFIQIVDLEGRVVARSANLGSVRLPTSPLLLAQLGAGEQVFETLRDFGDEPVRMLSAPVTVGGRTYAIQVAGSLDDASAALGSAHALFLIASAAILVAVGLTGALLATGILRPIDRIVSRARSMGASALAERLPHPGGRDEMARLVETLNEMLGRIEQVFEAQRRFTADASHELRSPLSRLRAELEVTLRRPRSRPEYEEALQSCLSEVERLSRLTEELLTLARLDAGEAQEIPAQPAPLAPILEEVVARMASDALRRNVKITLDAPADLTIKAAPGTAALVLANVLDNAVKFSPPGGEVRVWASIEAGDAIVSVSDSGPGVTEEEIPRLFERFYRGSAARRTEVPGTGLGLAICRILAESQGGGVLVTSGAGGGAIARVRLPLAA
jgi:two-component system, OmpR family, sensor kinase